ncbi:unnamed protein product [Mucor hiemalis]
MNLIQSSTFHSSTVAVDELLKDIEKQLLLWEDLGKPWKVKLSPISDSEDSNDYEDISYESEKLLHKNEERFQKLVAAQDLQIVQIASSAKLKQDTIQTIYQLQRNEDELRHKIELNMRDIEISILRKKLTMAEEMALSKKDELISSSDETIEKQESLASLSHQLNIARLTIQIRDIELTAIRKLIQDIKDSVILETNSILEKDIEIQKRKFQKLIDDILHGTRLIQTLPSGIQQADEVRRIYSLLNCPPDNHSVDLKKVKKSNHLDRSPNSIKRLSSLASGLLESLKDSAVDDKMNSILFSTFTTPIPSSVVPILRNNNSVLPKKSYLERAALNNRQKESFSTTLIQPPTPVIDKAKKVDRLPPIASLMPENTIDSNSVINLKPTTTSPNYTTYINSPENTSSLDLLSSVCPLPVPTSTLDRQNQEESFLANKLPPIKIPLSKLNIPYNNNTATTTKRPTELTDSKKANDPYANKRLRTFVKFRPDTL